VPNLVQINAGSSGEICPFFDYRSFSTHRKQQKSKKVILLNNTLTFGDVLLGNITFLIFAVFDV